LAARLKPLVFLLLVVGIILAVRLFHLQEYLDKDRLRQWVAGFGAWGPAVYLLIWTLAPPLLLPGLPITLAGGLLFGPFWGVVYTAFGATTGATLAFLSARYLVRDWVRRKIAGTKLQTLEEKVTQYGWRVVAFTRLVTIFPFFLLNYAFGLTGIALRDYVLATFFGMLPVTIAYVYFSANVLDLFQGKLSRELIIGAILLVLITLIPLAYRKIKTRRGELPEL
jgi:uncharacterized membrane protein YdjX (TVP38/TMEM64 family)